MKIISLLLLTIFLGRGCDKESRQDIKSANVEYTATTRGFNLKIVVQDQKAWISNDRTRSGVKPEPVKISDQDWKELLTEFQELDLDEIPNLKWPSERRFYDGAAIGGLKIVYKDKTYESQSFDHGYPPVEIERFVNKIVSLAKNEDEN